MSVALIHFLETSPSQTIYYYYFNGDTIEQVVCVIPTENMLSEAYVLPTIEKVGDEFLYNIELADYFVCYSWKSQVDGYWNETNWWTQVGNRKWCR